MHITVEGETVKECAGKLKAMASAYYHLADAEGMLINAPKDGSVSELKIGDHVIAVASFEDDQTLQRTGRMALRRVGPSKPAFEEPKQS
jgi:hypothetical protein